MGTKVRNLRTTHTKQSLVKAFFMLVNDKDFEKITIADLTERAQVNRATFYAHFKDKYDLLDYIMGDSASKAIEHRTAGSYTFDQESITQLIFAVCDYYEEPDFKCRRSYIGLVIPQLEEKMVGELSLYLYKSLENKYSVRDKALYVPIFAKVIHEAGYLWAQKNTDFSKEDIAAKISLLLLGENKPVTH